MYLSQVYVHDVSEEWNEGIERWWRSIRRRILSKIERGEKFLVTNKFCRRHIHHIEFLRLLISDVDRVCPNHRWMMWWNSMEMTINFPSFNTENISNWEKSSIVRWRSSQILPKHEMSAVPEWEGKFVFAPTHKNKRLSSSFSCTSNRANWHVLQQNWLTCYDFLLIQDQFLLVTRPADCVWVEQTLKRVKKSWNLFLTV